MELATGLDTERAIFSTLVGRSLPAHPVRCTASIGYFRFAPGIVRSVTGIEAARELPYVDELAMPFAAGDRVPTTMDSKSRHGHVIVSGSSAAQTKVRALAAAGRISVRTVP